MTNTSSYLFSRTFRRRRVLKTVASLLGLALFALSLLGIYLWQVPQSPQALRQVLVRQLEAATGAAARFEGEAPRLFVPDGRLELRDLAFFRTDENSSAPVFRVGRMEVTLSRAALLTGRVQPDQIVISEPSRLTYTYTSAGIQAGPAARFLSRTLDQLSRRPSGAGGEIKVRNVELVLSEGEPQDNPEGDLAPPIILRGELSSRSAPHGRPEIDFLGMLEVEEQHAALRGRLVLPGETSGSLELDLGPTDVSLRPAGRALRAAFPGGTRMHLAFNRREEVVDLAARILLPEILVNEQVAADDPFQLHDRSLEVVLLSEYDPRSATLTAHDFSFSSDQVLAQMRGSLAVEQPHSFVLNAAAAKVGGDYRRLLNRLLPPGYRIDAPRDGIRLELALAGDNRSLSSVDGVVALRGVTVESPALGKPLKEVAGEIRCRPGQVELRSVSARMGRTSLSLDGTLTGNYLAGEESLLDLGWKAATTPADLVALLDSFGGHHDGAAPPAGAVGQGGSISGEGILRHRVSLRSPSGAGVPELAGTITFDNVGFSHPALPAPVQDLTGKLQVEGEQVRVRSLAARLGETPVDLKGTVSGNRYFWRDPVLSGSLTTRLDAGDLRKYLPPDSLAALDRAKVQGQADCRLQLEVPLERVGEARLTGVATLRKGQADVETTRGVFQLRNLEGSLSWDGDALIVDRLSGRLNDEPLNASGFLSEEQIYLAVKGVVDLEAVTRSFPALDPWVEADGPAAVDLTLGERTEVINHYTNVGSNPTPAAVVELVRSVPPRISRAISAGRLDVNGSVVLGNASRGARLRHNGMPGGERRDEAGKPIPRGDMRNVRGRLNWKGNVISTPEGAPLQCDLADTRDCRIDASVELRPGNFPRMTLRGSSRTQARFDTWMTGWGVELPVPPHPPDTGRSFDLDVVFTAPRAIYKGQPAGRTRLELTFNVLQRPDRPRRTLFKSIQVDGLNGGRMDAQGEMLSYVWKAHEFPRWSADAQFQQMPMLPLLTWIFKDVRNIDGLTSGRMAVQGIKTDPLSIRGQGSTLMTDLIIDRTPLIQGLARATGHQFSGRRFSSVDTTNFIIDEGAIASRDLNLDSAGGLLLEMRGRYFFSDSPRYGARAQTVDARMRLKIFQSVLQQLPIIPGIPIVNGLADGLSRMADEVAGAFLLAFQVSGHVERPAITPIALPLFQGME